MSYVLSDAHGTPLMVFTGDTLFAGEVGRTDLPGEDRTLEMAGMLYDSLFEKLLPLGDGVIVCPAHGAGSVCGSSISDRAWTTIGTERLSNPRLKLVGRDDFLHATGVNVEKPPYFKKMEEYNQQGAPSMPELPNPIPVSADALAARINDHMVVLDTRSPEAFAGAFIPGSLAMPLNMLPAYAGYFVPYDRPIGLIVDDPEEVQTAVRYLVRMGYDRIECFLEGGLHSWEVSGRDFDSVGTITAQNLQQRIDEGKPFTLLDVRKITEFEEKRLDKATHIFLGHLPRELDNVPADKPVTTFCGSGRRAIIAASYLKMNGYDAVEDTLGSMSACEKTGCNIINGNSQ
jgi:hydroxyacylglutathione hydrolase